MKSHGKRPKSKIFEKTISAHFFKPQNELLPEEVYAKIELPVEEHQIRLKKLNLHGWKINAVENKGTIVFFHGSAGTNLSWKLLFHYLLNEGYSLWSFDYAGFGKSNGVTTFSSFSYDVDRIFEYIAEQEGVKIDQLILYGHSLGCFAVQHICSTFGNPAAVVLQSPVFSLEHLLSGKTPGFLLNYYGISEFTLESLYNSPVFCNVLIGEKDTLINDSYGISLWKDRRETNLLTFPDYKHASFIKPDEKILKKLKLNSAHPD
ncbi:MAG: alpha/beta fold hydrolase [Calditrichia bacterium]|nr:alpha/beta fold hydrolase [Calditrichia bacterium]